MKQTIVFTITLFLLITFFGSNGFTYTTDSKIEFYPVQHATMVIKHNKTTIYVDPVGEIEAFESFPKPDLIIVTDIHRDHLNKDVVNSVKRPDTLIISTKDGVAGLEQGSVLNNFETISHMGIKIEAIPAYNLTPERLKFHPKGRGNGYIITLAGKRVYISGDTEDIPEMRQLKNIDYAFVCMNLPYTMTEEQAASAVLEFKPKVVFPYHYRGKNGMSDINKFKELVNNKEIQVHFLDWY